MVVGDGVEVHRGVSIRGHRSSWRDVDRGDVGRVEQNLGPEGLGDRIAGIEGCVGESRVSGGDDHPRLLTGDGHAQRADVKPKPSCGVHVGDGGGDGIAIIHTGLHSRSAPC